MGHMNAPQSKKINKNVSLIKIPSQFEQQGKMGREKRCFQTEMH